MRFLALLMTVAIAILPASSQTPAQKPCFQAALIKRSTIEADGQSFAACPRGRLTVVNGAISNLINNAYGIANYQLIGVPDWVHSERYDIAAKGPETVGQVV